MEKQKQDDDKLLAIMQFIHHYDKGVSLTSLLNGTSFIKLIEKIPSYQYSFEIKLNMNASKWSQMLQNLQTIIYKIQQYFQSVHHKSLQTADVDLISLTKSQDLGQLIKYFEIVMTLLMESSCKEDFIQTIMVLQQTSQEIFVDIIKRSLDGCKFSKSKNEQNMFYRLINQFDEQRLAMEKQIQRLCKANMQLLSKIKQQQETISQIQLDLSTRKSGGQISNDDRTNAKYLQQYVDRLQIRIVQQTKAYEQQKLNSTQKINELQEKIAKLSQTEQLNKIYKQKYDQIMDQMQKMNIWKKQKAKMEKMMEEKDFMVQKLHDRIEQLAQKNLTLEQSELQSKLQLQKRQIKLQKMSSQLKKVMENIGLNNSTLSNKVFQGSLLDQSLKQCANLSNMKGNLEDSLFGTDEHANQIKKQNEKLLKKCKKQQKQICKLVKKVERLRFLQQDKNKLQQLVFQLRHTHSQQLNLMFAVFYEGFQQNLQISRKLRHEVLSYNEKPDEFVRKPKHSRKRTNSSIKGKQNWKQSANN